MNLSADSSPGRLASAGRVLYAGFNQDFSCFSVGHHDGFSVHNCDPLSNQMRKVYGAGVSICEMLFRTNFLALVGGGRNPQFPPNKVMLFDDVKGRTVVELEFRAEVKSVRLRRDRIVVALATRVYVYTLSSSPVKLAVYETHDNDKGLCAVCAATDNSLLAMPGRQPGHIQLVDLNRLPAVSSTSSSSLSTASSSSPPTGATGIKLASDSSTAPRLAPSIIPAHTTMVGCLALNFDGSLLATTSVKGTLIRIYDTASGRQLYELRRGSDRAEIWSMAFNGDSSRLCVGSDKGTIHVFTVAAQQSIITTSSAVSTPTSLTPRVSQLVDDGHGRTDSRRSSEASLSQLGTSPTNAAASSANSNRQSSFSFMKDLLPKYFSSEWSFAHCHVPSEAPFICCFGNEPNSIIAICADGSYYKFLFDAERGGAGRRQVYNRFLQQRSQYDDDDEFDTGKQKS